MKHLSVELDDTNLTLPSFTLKSIGFFVLGYILQIPIVLFGDKCRDRFGTRIGDLIQLTASVIVSFFVLSLFSNSTLDGMFFLTSFYNKQSNLLAT